MALVDCEADVDSEVLQFVAVLAEEALSAGLLRELRLMFVFVFNAGVEVELERV